MGGPLWKGTLDNAQNIYSSWVNEKWHHTHDICVFLHTKKGTLHYAQIMSHIRGKLHKGAQTRTENVSLWEEKLPFFCWQFNKAGNHVGNAVVKVFFKNLKYNSKIDAGYWSHTKQVWSKFGTLNNMDPASDRIFVWKPERGMCGVCGCQGRRARAKPPFSTNLRASWLPNDKHDNYQWEIWKKATGKSTTWDVSWGGQGHQKNPGKFAIENRKIRRVAIFIVDGQC